MYNKLSHQRKTMRFYASMLASIILTTQLYSTEQPVVDATTPPQNVIIHNHIHANSNARSENATNVQQEAYLSNVSTQLQNTFGQARNQAQEYTYGIFSWIAQNKKKTVLYSAAIGYGYIWYKLLSLNYALSQNTRWSHWRKTVSLEELLAKPQSDIATDLLTAIQRQYTSQEELNNLIGPLTAFLKDIDIEIHQLKQVINLHVWIDRLRISFLFPKQSALLEEAQDNIHRLTYLKNVLLNWVIDNKVARLSSPQFS